jgi:hypothetical protein
MSEHQLAKLDKARQMLAESRDLSEVLDIRDLAEGAKAYAKAHRLGLEAQNYAAEIALLAARKAGEILRQLERKQGHRTDKLPANFAESSQSDYSKVLKESAIPERTGQYWQKLAAIPQETVTKYVSEVSKAGGEISTSGLLKAQPHAEKRKNRSEPVKDFEELRILALKMINEGYRQLKAVGVDPSHLDAAKSWAKSRIE